jgi:hypothetical protein
MFKLTIQTDNAAFTDQEETEVARILREIATKLENGRSGGFPRDANGNNVGEWELS